MVIAVRTETGPGGLEVVKEADTADDSTRLAHEADVLARVAHPGVVEVISATTNSLHLRHGGVALARLPHLEVDHLVAIVRNLAETVDALHRQGVAHNRITADHILIDRRGRPRLGSFGASTAADEATTADDVAALAAVLDHSITDQGERTWSESFRGPRHAKLRKRAVAACRQATAAARRDDPAQRPTARQFGTALADAIPGLALPAQIDTDDEPIPNLAESAPPEGSAPGGPGFAAIPNDFDPTADLGWTADDLSFLAELDEDDDAFDLADDEPTGRDPYAELADLTTPAGRTAQASSTPGPTRKRARSRNRARSKPPTKAAPGVWPTAPDPGRRDAPVVPGPAKRRLAPIAAAVLVFGLVAGVAITRASHPFAGDPETAATVSPAGSSSDAATLASPPSTWPSTCRIPVTPGPDLDGDGCPESIRVVGRTATVGEISILLGEEGDLVAVGDSDCDGVATPVLLRPATGEVFTFEAWDVDAPVTVSAATVVAGGATIATADGPCPAIVVTSDDGSTTTVAGLR